MNSICFHPDAESEMNQAAAWYETQQHNLGKRFLTSIQDALNRIQLHPKLYPGLYFDRSMTEGLARYALSVDFDFYYLYSDGREDT